MASTLNGVDLPATLTAANITCLQTNGISFVGRYYSNTTHIQGKVLTASEASLISQNGLQIVAVFEDAPTSASYFSSARGTSDAQAAMTQAAAAGQPEGTAIYFTVDYDASASDIAGVVTQYFQALAAALNGKYILGVYGSGATCAAMTGNGTAAMAWLAQSTGWSGYANFTNWVIKQGPESTVCGLGVDTDTAQGNFGAFTV